MALAAGRALIPEMNNRHGAVDGTIKDSKGQATAIVENKGTSHDDRYDVGKSGMYQAATYAAGLTEQKSGREKPPTLFAFNGANTAHPTSTERLLDIKSYNMQDELDRHRVQALMKNAAKTELDHDQRNLHKAERAKIWRNKRKAAVQARDDKFAAMKAELEAQTAAASKSGPAPNSRRLAAKREEEARKTEAALKKLSTRIDRMETRNQKKKKAAGEAAASAEMRLQSAKKAVTGRKDAVKAEGRSGAAKAIQANRDRIKSRHEAIKAQQAANGKMPKPGPKPGLGSFKDCPTPDLSFSRT
ncbi:hypothetical protein DFJ73DRAFT_777687 [Zopfochytrium polystomum]|nr:hypothetical protein DFJ73DRAFT_777687 [Zopfochytrium polystomum]